MLLDLEQNLKTNWCSSRRHSANERLLASSVQPRDKRWKDLC